jgi:hypothetical protein
MRKTSIGGRSIPRRPAAADPVVSWAERPVEGAGGPVDGADDRVQRDLLDPKLGLAGPAERGHDLLERQHRRHVVGLRAQARDDPRQRPPPALTIEVGLGGDL